MYILNQKVKKKYDVLSNLKFNDLDNSILKRKYLKKGQLKHNPSSVKEWYNSVYSFNKNNFIKTLLLKDKFIYKLFDVYFNMNKLKIYNSLSMSKIFIGKPEVKHFNNKMQISLYIFNKWIIRFYRISNMIKTTEMLFSLKSEQIENKPFVMALLLLKYYKFDQRSITFFNKLLTKLFSNYNNNTSSNSNKFIKTLYENIVVFFDKSELYDLLGLNRNTNMYTEKLLINEHGLNKKIRVINKDLFKISSISKNTKIYLYLYMYIINYLFNCIRFPKMISILRKVLLFKVKEKEVSDSITMLENLKKNYLIKFKIDSFYVLIRLIKIFFDLKKILKSMYLIKWYKRNIYHIKRKFSIKNILFVKNVLSKLYNNKIEINIINLKYLYLDGNILALTVIKKLKSRKRRVLKVIRMALSLSKKPYINKFHSDWLSINSLDNVFIKKDFNTSINNIPLNKDLSFKPISYKSRIIFFYLKHKIISGLKLQGTGRLTKRLTASRSISKFIGKGSLKNRASSYNGLSTVVLRGYVKSNMQYININSYNRIGAYGIKSWVSSY
jgi:hypothetical protein